jgi:hypothetical protein
MPRTPGLVVVNVGNTLLIGSGAWQGVEVKVSFDRLPSEQNRCMSFLDKGRLHFCTRSIRPLNRFQMRD